MKSVAAAQGKNFWELKFSDFRHYGKIIVKRFRCECADGCVRADRTDAFIGLLHVTSSKNVSFFEFLPNKKLFRELFLLVF